MSETGELNDWREISAALRSVRGDRYCYCWMHNTTQGKDWSELTHTDACREAMRLTGCEYGEEE